MPTRPPFYRLRSPLPPPPPDPVAPVLLDQSFVVLLSALPGAVIGTPALAAGFYPLLLDWDIDAGNGAGLVAQDDVTGEFTVVSLPGEETTLSLTVSVANAAGGSMATITISFLAAPPLTAFSSVSFVEENGEAVVNRYVQVGLPTVPGDVGPEEERVLTLLDGTPMLAQFDEKNRWRHDAVGDGFGSDCWVACSFFVPAGLGPGEAITFRQQKRTGTYVPDPRRSLSDITSRDFKARIRYCVSAAGVMQGTNGTFWARVNDVAGIPARRRVYADGAVKLGVEFTIPLLDEVTGDPHPHLVLFWDIEAVSDAEDLDLLSGFRLSPEMSNSKMGVAGATLFFYEISIWDGDQLILDHGITRTFDAAAVDASTDRVSAPGHDIMTGECWLPSNPDTLPPGLPATFVYTRKLDAGAYEFNTDQYRANSQDASGVTPGRVNLTGQGSGTTTLKRYIAHPYGTWQPILPRDGKPIWWGGDMPGSPAPSMRQRRTLEELQYIVRSGFIPGFDLSKSYGAGVAIDYVPGNVGLIYNAINAGAANSRPGIGAMPAWCHKAFVTQDAGYMRQARVNALAGAQFNNQRLNEEVVEGHALMRMPAMNNGPAADGVGYPGLGTPRPNSRWFSTTQYTADIVNPSGPGGIFGEGSSPDGSHIPALQALPAMLEAEHHQIRHLRHMVNRHVLAINPYNPSTGSRKRFVEGQPHYGLLVGLVQIRCEGHIGRDAAYAGAIGNDQDPECQLIRDYLRSSFTYHRRKRETDPGFANIGAHIHWPLGSIAYGERGFMGAYVAMHAALMDRLTRSADSAGYRAHCAKRILAGFRGRIGGSAGNIDGYTFMIWTGSAWVASFEDMGITNEIASAAGSSFMTLSTNGLVDFNGQWRADLANGQLFWPCGTTWTVPEFQKNRAYYMVEADNVAKIFKLAETLAGAAKTVAAGATQFDGFIVGTSGPAAGGLASGTVPSAISYMAIAHAAAMALSWGGEPDMEDVVEEAVARMAGTDLSTSTGPLWAITDTIKAV